MALDSGARLGPYEVTGVLGAGGMGAVYRARDSRLERDVAIKALPEFHQGDPERVRRFQREAQILASLNHPHVAAIYGLEEVGSEKFLILELVEGQTLADRLKGGRLAIAEALRIARQVADGLQAAHDRGIVHRDLKPANIALTPQGDAKVLDFGLAKAFAADGPGEAEDGPTITSAETRDGVVLGTAAYMSPEQARGRPLDKRTDIWAFGCVLFEMLAGTLAYPGETVSDTLAAILEREPDWRRLPPATPTRIVWLLRRCLEKDARRRLHDIADARIEIDEALTRPVEPGAVPAAGRASRRERIAWGVAGVCLVALVATFVATRQWTSAGTSLDTRTYRVAVLLPETLRLHPEPAGRFSLSPDGRRLAFAASDASGRTLLWVRPLEAGVAQPLPGTEEAKFPFWSPDSRAIAFLAQGRLKKVDVALGQVVTLCAASFSSTGAWFPDGSILFTPTGESPLFRVTSSSGVPEPATRLDAEAGEVQHSYPFVLPDGRHFLYFGVGNKGNRTEARGVFVGSVGSTGPGRLILPRASNAKYTGGHVIFVRDGVLLAQRFDTDRLEVTGEPTSIVEQVQVSPAATSGAVGGFSVSQNGILAFQGGPVLRSELAWYTRAGVRTGTIGAPADQFDVSLSPDGSRVAVSLLDPSAASRDVWIYDVARGLPERFTFDPGDDFAPNWVRPDGARIVFSSRRQGSVDLYEKPTAGTGTERLLWADDLGKFNASTSADGRFAVYVGGGGIIGRSDLWVLPLLVAPGVERKASPFADTPALETHGQFSPDGRWIAYTLRQSGRDEVYVTSFPERQVTRRVSSAGGSWPRWARSGREIFYLRPDSTLVAAAVDTSGSEFRVETEQALFVMRARVREGTRLDSFPYDVHPDGQRLIVNQLVEDPSATAITLIINWAGARAK